MRVLQLLSSNTFSGAENVACQIIDMFNGEIEMAYCSPDGEIANTLKKRGIKFFPLKEVSSKELKGVIREFKPNVVHSHDIRASVVAATVFHPIVSHIHGNHLELRKPSVKSLLFFLASIRFKKIFFVSQSCLDYNYFKKQYLKKSLVLSNVIDPSNVMTKANEDCNEYNFDGIFLGRLEDVKDPNRLLDITQKVVAKSKDFKLAVVGDGSLLEDTKLRAKELNIFDNVHFFGYCNNPYGILKQAKVMIMCSKHEGTPMAVLESLSLGVPVVSTPTDGVVDIIQNGYNGYLSNDNNELSERIIEVIGEQSFAQNAAATGKKINDIATYKKIMTDCYYTAKE